MTLVNNIKSCKILKFLLCFNLQQSQYFRALSFSNLDPILLQRNHFSSPNAHNFLLSRPKRRAAFSEANAASQREFSRDKI